MGLKTMNRVFKKFASLVMALFLMATLLPVSAFADIALPEASYVEDEYGVADSDESVEAESPEMDLSDTALENHNAVEGLAGDGVTEQESSPSDKEPLGPGKVKGGGTPLPVFLILK